jgi:peroxiredoxin
VGIRVDEFRLQDYRGKWHALSDYKDKQVVVLAFLGTECPLAKLYGPRLSALAQRYESVGVTFLAVNANRQDSVTDISLYARDHNIHFPVLKDVANRLADRLGAQRTPEVFVLDNERVVRYRGRIDDQYEVGTARNEPTQNDLANALDELLAGKEVTTPVTRSVGCFIGRITAPDPDCEVTYSRHVARLFQKHCVECHRPGEIGPFSLTDYDEVVGWAATIEEVVRAGRMPPWHADPRFGEFENARGMTDEEKQTVYEWAANGAPEGDPDELPPPIDFVDGWRLPQEPELVIPMREQSFSVPAEGTVEYQYFVTDPKFTQDKWISAAEIIPGNRAVVHHALVFVRPPDSVDHRVIGWLAGYVPGQSTMILPKGQGKRIPAGSKLVFQMHYAPNGSVQEDITKLGLVFADPTTVQEEAHTVIAINREFEIPPFAKDFQVHTTVRSFPRGSKILALAPHMHLRGKAFRFESVHDDEREVLLDVPNYDFNWQHVYKLANPIPIDRDFVVECTAKFDNSADNPWNPDPSDTVRWGDQTWEEMVVAFFEVAVPRGHQFGRGDKSQLTKAELDKAARLGQAWIERFDRDKNGEVSRREVPASIEAFAFGKIDRNGDKVVTPDEAIAFAKRSLRDER